MANFIMSLVNLKNAVVNCIVVRILWAIIGAVGFFMLMSWTDDARIESGRKPMFLKKGWHTSEKPKKYKD